MSEVDRLSHAPTYPAAPIGTKRRTKEDSRQPFGEPPDPAAHTGDPEESAAQPRPPKSIIDEFA